jgi:hypothetical protein
MSFIRLEALSKPIIIWEECVEYDEEWDIQLLATYYLYYEEGYYYLMYRRWGLEYGWEVDTGEVRKFTSLYEVYQTLQRWIGEYKHLSYEDFLKKIERIIDRR